MEEDGCRPANREGPLAGSVGFRCVRRKRPLENQALAAKDPELHVEFSPLKIVSTSARDFWAPTLIKRALGFVASDDRPGAPQGNLFWPGNQRQAGQVLHGYGSTWLPAGLLQPDRRAALGGAIFAATRHWGVSLRLNKGLAGAPAEAITAARDRATNPAVLDAFALWSW